MGSVSSKHSNNDFELCVRASKELEYLLANEFGAIGSGLHEKISSVEHHLTPEMVRNMRYLATIRNKLVHEHDFNEIPDRTKFIRNFELSRQELGGILQARKSKYSKKDACIMM